MHAADNKDQGFSSKTAVTDRKQAGIGIVFDIITKGFWTQLFLISRLIDLWVNDSRTMTFLAGNKGGPQVPGSVPALYAEIWETQAFSWPVPIRYMILNR